MLQQQVLEHTKYIETLKKDNQRLSDHLTKAQTQALAAAIEGGGSAGDRPSWIENVIDQYGPLFAQKFFGVKPSESETEDDFPPQQ